jgi:hypothetical protein
VISHPPPAFGPRLSTFREREPATLLRIRFAESGLPIAACRLPRSLAMSELNPVSESLPPVHVTVNGDMHIHVRDNAEPLNVREQDIMDALGDQRLTAEELAKRAGYKADGYFRSLLSRLRKRGLLVNLRPGYQRTGFPNGMFDPSQGTRESA